MKKLSQTETFTNFAKVDAAKFSKDIDSQKFMNMKNIFFLNSGKLMLIKNKYFNSFYLFQTTNLVKLIQIFSQELSS